MLILERKIGESDFITLPTGEVIQIVIVDINLAGSRVKVGIKGPRRINVVRSELLEREDR